MKVREEQFALQLPRDSTRSEGLHLSDVIRSLAFKWDILAAKYDKPVEDSDTTLMQVGLGWENYLAQYQHPEIQFHPGELEMDGIIMSPDGFSVQMGDDGVMDVWWLHEFKFTRKSSRDFAEMLRLRGKKILMWLWQIMSYRHALNKMLRGIGMPSCYEAKLHVMFINGNYSRDDSDPDGKPSYKIYRITFKPEELEDNWTMILNHANVMSKEKKA